MRKHLQLIFFVGLMLSSFLAKSSSATVGGGYTDSLGTYIWFEEQTDSTLQMGGRNWYLISQNRLYWQEAITIRRANLEALLSLGFDSAQVMLDLHLYPGNSSLFSKHCFLKNSDKYISKWQLALNSEDMTHTARRSEEIVINNKRTYLVLKFYPAKGGMENTSALGLVERDFFTHCVEAGLEIFEYIIMKISKEEDSQRDVLYDAHLRNARRLLRIGDINFEDLVA